MNSTKYQRTLSPSSKSTFMKTTSGTNGYHLTSPNSNKNQMSCSFYNKSPTKLVSSPADKCKLKIINL
jgi:hypothetical protein